MSFRSYTESGGDIFGFNKPKPEDFANTELENQPIKSFNTELMMRYLSRNKIGVTEAAVPFMNEIIWGGNHWGAVKLEVSPRMIFLISRLGRDMEGNPRWITKKCYQLNRRGYGNHEEAVAAEVMDQIKNVAESGLEGPNKDFNKLAELTDHIATKLRQCAQQKFLFRGIKRVSDDNYQIVFEIGGQGVEARNHHRVEQAVVDLSYDRQCGTINVRQYNVESKVGNREWKVQPCFLNLYFFPSQERNEIADPFMVLMKYY